MKKINLKNYMTKKRILEFLDAKGFYLVLILCIGIITVTAYVVTKSNLQSYVESSSLEELSRNIPKPQANLADASKPASTNVEEKVKNQVSKTSSNTNVAQKQTNSTDAASKELKENKDTKQSDNTNKKTPVSLQMPVLGDIIQDYSKNHLVYSKTLEQWTTHEGLDIYSDRGTPVKAAADGVVESVHTDYKYGITVILDHGNGFKTRYCNLSTDNMVKKGANIKKGDVISGIGNTAMFESGEQPHLHFEVVVDSANVNPKNYIK